MRQAIHSLSPAFMVSYLKNQDVSVHSVVMKVLGKASSRLLGDSSFVESTSSNTLTRSNEKEKLLKTIFYKESDGTIIAVFPNKTVEKLSHDHTFYQCFSNRSNSYICNKYLDECCELATRSEYILTELQLNLLGYVLEITNESLENPRSI